MAKYYRVINGEGLTYGDYPYHYDEHAIVENADAPALIASGDILLSPPDQNDTSGGTKPPLDLPEIG